MNKDQQLNKLFDAARSEAPKTSFDETKTQFIKQTSTTVSNQSLLQRLINIKNGFIMLAITSLITAGIIFFSGETKEEINTTVKNQSNETISITSIYKKEEAKLQPSKPTKTPIYVNGLKQGLSSQPQILASKPVKVEVKDFPKVEEGYRFPKLTEEDKEKVRKKKEEMVKRVQEKEGYTNLPHLLFSLKKINTEGKESFKEGYISNTEVTNLEYRTFLFDLLMQNRKDDFLLAKPDQNGWGTFVHKDSVQQSPYVSLYFSHPSYDNYPVVNISVLGAKMYCEWMTETLNQNSDSKSYLFSRPNYEVNIPTYGQWRAIEHWIGIDSLPFNGIDSKKHANYANNTPISNLDDRADITVPVDLYPNKIGVANVFGNVSEIIQLEETFYAIGGSWEDSLEDLKIKNKIELAEDFNGSRRIGFRPVFNKNEGLYLADKTNIPVFNAKEIKELNKRKKDLIKNLIKRKGYAAVRKDCSDCPYLSQTEITNKDYKTFLFDLIQSGKITEYRKYAPYQQGWNMAYGKSSGYMIPMVEEYFAHPAYDNFPLVNVSMEGMKAYMAWLNDMLGKEEGYSNQYKVSLPSKELWETALKDGDNSLIPWTDDELALYHINYNNFSEIAPYGPNPGRNLSKELQEKAKVAGLKTPFIQMHTGLVWIGHPNEQGFKNLLGNVSEVVESNGNYISVGGSWLDSLASIKQMKEEVISNSFKGSATVGYRLALRIEEDKEESSDSEYRFPKITEEEIALVKEQKKLLFDKNVALQSTEKSGNGNSTIANGRYVPLKLNDQTLSDSLGLIKYMDYLNYESGGRIMDQQISNVQYRAFLFDLLIQGRKNDFLIAKPYQDNWKKYQKEPYLLLQAGSSREDYFSHPYFNDYPAVNIPLEGMKLFCKWYSDVLNEKSKTEKDFGYYSYCLVELPSDKEWSQKQHRNFNGAYPLKDSSMHITPANVVSEYKGFFDDQRQWAYLCDIGEVIQEGDEYFLKGFNWLSGFKANVHIESKTPFIDQQEGSLLVGFRPIIRNVSKPMINPTHEIPQLTDNDIKINNENKAKLLKDFSKEKGLMFIPLGTMVHDDFNNGKALSVQSFFMAETETTIKDYQTFLFDLVIQGRTEDYLIAKPKIDYQAPRYSWNFYEEFVTRIKSNPITGVSPAGAKLYCKWLSEEMSKNYTDSNIKGAKSQWSFRLPTENEWYYACSGGKLRYPMVFDTTYYRENALWQKDSTINLGFGVRTVKDGNKNPFGLYHLEGNAREMVTSNDSVFFAGGSNGVGFMPMSYFHYDNLGLAESNQVYKADVGFRVVLTYLGGNPPKKIIVK